VCRKYCRIEPSTYPRQDATCPHCGGLLVLDQNGIRPWSLDDFEMRQRAEPEEVEVRLSIEEITDLAEIAALERELGMANAE
jgi:hypothetical protein